MTQTFLDLSLDAVFKSFFKGDTSLLISLLSHFLPLSRDSLIEDVLLLDPELSPEALAKQGRKFNKTFILDLRATIRRKIDGTLREAEIVNVEIQTSAQEHFTDRLLVYSGRLFSDQLTAGGNFNELRPVYSLVFTTVNLKEFRSLKETYYHVCNIRRVGSPEIVMSRSMYFVIVELGKFKKMVRDVFDKREKWCYLLKNSSKMKRKEIEHFKQGGGVMARALKHLETVSEDEALREYAMVKERDRRDRVDQDLYITKRGMEQGFAQGMEEGLEKGMEKGMEKGIQETALKMLKEGLDMNTIEKVTGLAQQDIKKLGKRNS